MTPTPSFDRTSHHHDSPRHPKPWDMERLKQAEFARMSWCEARRIRSPWRRIPSNNMASEAIKQDNWNTVYPDVDPRGASSRRTRQVLRSAGLPSPIRQHGRGLCSIQCDPFTTHLGFRQHGCPRCLSNRKCPQQRQGNVQASYMQANQATYPPPTSPATYVIPTSPAPPVNGGFPR